MLNAYFTMQTLKKGFPETHAIKLFRFRELGTFEDARNWLEHEYDAWAERCPESPIALCAEEFSTLIGSLTEDAPNNCMIIDGYLFSIHTKTGSEIPGV